MARTLDLGIVLFARDKASGPVRKVKLQVDGLTQSQGRQAKSARRSAQAVTQSFIPAIRGLAFAATGAAAAITKIALDTGEYEREIRLAAFLTRTSAGEFDNLDRTVRDLGKQFGIVPVEVSKALQAVGRLGIEGKDAIEVTSGALQLMAASAGELGAQGAVDLLAAAMRSFGIDASKTESVVDSLSNATTSTALDFKRLGLALGTASGFAAQFGGTLEETLTLLGLTRDVIVRAERGATGVRNIFKDLTKTTLQTKLAQAGLNIEVADASGNFRNIFAIAKDLNDQMGGLTQQQRAFALQTAFSVEAAGVLAALSQRVALGVEDMDGALQQGTQAMVALEQRIRETSGTGQEFVDITLFGMAGAARIAKATWEDFKIELGRAINTVLVPSLRILTNVIGFFTKVLSALGPTGQVIIGIIALLGVVAGAVSLPIIALSLATGTWAGVSALAAKTTFALGVALRFLLSPLGLVIALLTLAVTLAIALANAMGADIPDPLEAAGLGGQEEARSTIDESLAAGAGNIGAFAGGGIRAFASGQSDVIPRPEREAFESGEDVGAALADPIQRPERAFAEREGVEVVREQPVIIQLDRREVGKAVLEFMEDEKRRNFETRPRL